MSITFTPSIILSSYLSTTSLRGDKEAGKPVIEDHWENLPENHEEYLTYVNKYKIKEDIGYPTFPQHPEELERLKYHILHNSIQNQEEIFKLLEEKVNKYEKIIIGEFHYSEHQFQFINEILKRLKGIKGIALEQFFNDPEHGQRVDEVIARKVQYLIQKSGGNELIMERLLLRDRSLHQVFLGDMQGIINQYLRGNKMESQNAWLLLSTYIQIGFGANEKATDERIEILKIAKEKKYEVIGMDIPQNYSKKTYEFLNDEERTILRNIYMSKFLCAAAPKTIGIVGWPHIFSKTGIVSYVKNMKEDMRIYCIWLRGGIFDNTKAFDRMVKEIGWSNKLFAVEWKGYLIIHLPEKEKGITFDIIPSKTPIKIRSIPISEIK